MPPLRALAEVATCTLVVTQPDRPAGRGKKLVATPVKLAARELRIPTIEPERLREAYDALARERADFFAVASYGKIISQRVLDLVPIAFNVHPSLLPRYRGATPLQSQLRDGVRASGVSVIAMDAGMDTGDVVVVRTAGIDARETYGEVHDRFAKLGAVLLREAVLAYAAGSLERTAQTRLGTDAEANRTLTRPLAKDDLRVSLAWSPERIVDSVRALAPQPMARATIAGEEVKLASAHLATGAEAERLLASPILASFAAAMGSDGESSVMVTLQVRAEAPDAVVLARDGSAAVIERVVPPSRSAMPAAAYLRSLVASRAEAPA